MVTSTSRGATVPAGTGDTAPALPLALYVHFPWCVQKCPYCDFNSHTLRDTLPESDYVDALLRDLAFECETRSLDADPRRISSVFLGGGTPSLFDAHAIARVLQAADDRIGLTADCEITLEANPGTVDARHFAGYRAAGINRLSIGVQSFDDAKLRALGRIHNADAARQAMTTARNAGFDNINLDLMFALPQQSPGEALADLRAAIALAPEHLSYYHLTLEPNTAFAAQPPTLPDDDTAATMLDDAALVLEEAGYRQYETSAWARAGKGCAHNLNYWRFGDYLGIGAGAHGKISRVVDGALQVTRSARVRHPKAFLQTAGCSEALQRQERISAEALPFEFAMNALRLHEGFDWPLWQRSTGLGAQCLAAPLARAEALGLIVRDDTGVRPTQHGRAHLNSLLGLFL